MAENSIFQFFFSKYNLSDLEKLWWNSLLNEYYLQYNDVDDNGFIPLNTDIDQLLFLFEHISYSQFIDNTYIKQFYHIIFKSIEQNKELLGILLYIFTPINFYCKNFVNQLQTIAQVTCRMDIPVQKVIRQTLVELKGPMVYVIPIVMLRKKITQQLLKKSLYLFNIYFDPENFLTIKIIKDLIHELQQQHHATIFYSNRTFSDLGKLNQTFMYDKSFSGNEKLPLDLNDEIKNLLAKYMLHYRSVSIHLNNLVDEENLSLNAANFLVEIDDKNRDHFSKILSYLNIPTHFLGESELLKIKPYASNRKNEIPYKQIDKHLSEAEQLNGVSEQKNICHLKMASLNDSLCFDINKIFHLFSQENYSTPTAEKNDPNISTSYTNIEFEVNKKNTYKFLKNIKGSCPDTILSYFPEILNENNYSQDLPVDLEIIKFQSTNYLIFSTEIVLVSAEENVFEKITKGVLFAVSKIMTTGHSPQFIQLSMSRSVIKQISKHEILSFKDTLNSYFPEVQINFYVSSNITNDSSTIESIHIVAGLISNDINYCQNRFKNKGDLILLIGNTFFSISSHYTFPQYYDEKVVFDYMHELSHLQKVKELVQKKYLRSIKAITSRGLYYALITSATDSGLGFDITTHSEIRTDVFLFSEEPSRFLLTIAPENEEKVFNFLIKNNVPFTVLGHVTKEELRIDDISFGFVSDYMPLVK